MDKFHSGLDFSLVGVVPKFVPFTKEYDMAGKKIRGVFGDVGGLKAYLPVFDLALEAGCTIDVLLVGASAEQVQAGKLSLDDQINVQLQPSVDGYLAVPSFVEYDVPHDLTVVGCSQSLGAEPLVGTVSAAWAMFESSAPTFMLQDMYGSAHDTLKFMVHNHSLDRLNCLCVTDGSSADLLLKAGFNLKGLVVVTGGPQFDHVPEMVKTWRTRRDLLRQELDAEDNQTVFLVVGGKGGTAEILQLLEEAVEIAGLAKETIVVFRPHPSAPADDKEQTEAYFKKTTRHWFRNVDQSIAPSADVLLPAADYVLSSFSTANLLAIMCEMPGVVYVGTPGCKADLLRQKGLACPPEVEAGAGWYAQTPAELVQVFEELHHEDSSETCAKLKEAQQKISAYGDGLAAQRVWQEMQKLMS